jgi:hypothetical protein
MSVQLVEDDQDEREKIARSSYDLAATLCRAHKLLGREMTQELVNAILCDIDDAGRDTDEPKKLLMVTTASGVTVRFSSGEVRCPACQAKNGANSVVVDGKRDQMICQNCHATIIDRS